MPESTDGWQKQGKHEWINEWMNEWRCKGSKKQPEMRRKGRKNHRDSWKSGIFDTGGPQTGLPSELRRVHTSAAIEKKNERSRARPKSMQERVFTDWPGVELCVQNLQRLQVPLGVGLGLGGIRRTRHFLFFFVLHLCIDVEAWDLPWGKIYSEPK